MASIGGTVGDDTRLGGSGSDSLFGGHGDDRLLGGNGTDRLSGGDGADRLAGGSGNDLALGSTGDDRLDGGAGDDRLEGAAGEDLLVGGAGNDVGTGGDDADRLSGGAGDDRLIGGNGNDVVSGGDGVDRLSGGEGDDRLSGGDEADVLVAGAGNDRLTTDAVDGLLDGGAGIDTATADADGGVLFDLAAGTVQPLDAADGEVARLGVPVVGTVLRGIEHLRGGASGDSAVAAYHELLAPTATSTITHVDLAAGADTLDGTSSRVRVIVDTGPGTVVADLAGSRVLRVVHVETLTGGALDDTLVARRAPTLVLDRFDGGAGAHDEVDASGAMRGRTRVDLGDGTIAEEGARALRVVRVEQARTGDASDELDLAPHRALRLASWDAGAGEHDRVDARRALHAVDIDLDRQTVDEPQQRRLTLAGVDDAVGSAFADRLAGSELANSLFGLAGDDASDGGAGDDVLSGGEGDDTLTGASGTDLLSGGDGNDRLTGDAAADTLLGGTGDDTVEGGAGVDLLAGGEGRDSLVGGDGNDVFVQLSLADSGHFDDLVADFVQGEDVIDLSRIDADLASDGDQAFTFIGAATAFTGPAQAFTFQIGGFTYVYLNGDADLDADSAFAVAGTVDLTEDDFVL